MGRNLQAGEMFHKEEEEDSLEEDSLEEEEDNLEEEEDSLEEDKREHLEVVGVEEDLEMMDATTTFVIGDDVEKDLMCHCCYCFHPFHLYLCQSQSIQF